MKHFKKHFLVFFILLGLGAYYYVLKEKAQLNSQDKTKSASLSFPYVKATGTPKTINIDHIFEGEKNNREPAGWNKLLVNASRIQLTGKFLLNKKTLKIINKSNQFTATVFVTRNKFQTDYIDLQRGLNEIIFEWEQIHSDKISYQTLWLDVN